MPRLQLANAGGVASPFLIGWLGSGSPYFTADPTPRPLGVLDPGETLELSGFAVSVAPECPPLYSGAFHFHVEGPGHYHAMVILPIVMGQILVADMEHGAAGWTHAALPGWQDTWHLETFRNHTDGGLTSWKFGGPNNFPYGNSSGGALETAPFELPGGSVLTFWHWRNIQEGYDGGLLQISADGGAWTTLVPEGGYPHTVTQQGPCGPGPFPTGAGVWSGTAGWEQVTVDLGGWAASRARLRWLFGSDGSTIYEGWYIDDVLVLNEMPVTSAEHGPAPITRPALHPARPNPASAAGAPAAVVLAFDLPAGGAARLEIFDPAGRRVRCLAEGFFAAGPQRMVWDGCDDHGRPAPAGSYFCRLQAGAAQETRTMTLMR